MYTNGRKCRQEKAGIRSRNAVNWQEAAQASSSAYDAASRRYLTVTFMTTLLDGQSKQVLSHIKVLETIPSQHHAIHSELILMSLSFL